jgi:SpoVK/Ycf46/Vps4 family AAA+-type ATPase
MGIIRAALSELPEAEKDVSNLLANKTKDFSGASLKNVCQYAYKLTIRESIKEKKNRIGQIADFDEPAALQIRCDHIEC